MSCRTVAALTICLVALGISPASAEYLSMDVEKIPVERLVKNLEAALREHPEDWKSMLNLARAHAMAYSTKSETLRVLSKDPEQVWFGYEAPIVPFRKVVRTNDPEKLKAAKVHLDAALKLYAEALKGIPSNDVAQVNVAQLGHAWLLTQTDKKADAIPILRNVIRKAWEVEKPREAGREGIVLAAEAGEYLLPLLDPEKDKAEIASLKETAEELARIPRAVTPIAVPLAAGLGAADLEDRSAHVSFDADGTGRRTSWTWITPNAAWLVYDPKRRGKITTALQLFGNVTFWIFWDTGYEALAALDDNHDGRLAGGELEGLALWQDVNGNGISEPGEVRPLSEFGIVAISCDSQRDAAHPDKIAYSPKGVTFKDGSTRPTYDLVLHSR
jgi:hypothetical protein